MRHSRITTGLTWTCAVIFKSGFAYADATMTCPEIAMNMLLVPLELVQEYEPAGQKNNLAGPEGQAIVQVTSGSACAIEIAGKDAGTADFVRILARHKDDPEVGYAGDGMYVPISGYTNNVKFALNASHVFEFNDELSVIFSGSTPRSVSSNLPGGDLVVSKIGEISDDGGIPLAAKDFYILRDVEKADVPDMRCGWDVVGHMTSEPGPNNSVSVSAKHPVLAAATPNATLKVENIQCEYIQKKTESRHQWRSEYRCKTIEKHSCYSPS